MTHEALLKLQAWLSPAFPTGAFAYSHGLEFAVERGDVRDADTLRTWIEDVLRHGTGWTDAIMMRHGDPEFVRAVVASRERLMETANQGAAFALAARPWGEMPGDLPYPLAVAHLAIAHGIDTDATVAAYLQAFAGNLISAAVRLVPLGQSTGLAVLAALMPVILDVAERSRAATLDDIGGACFCSDIAAMRHETQYTRLFRS